MVTRLIVPVDESHESWRAFDVAIALARRCVVAIDVMHVVVSERNVDEARNRLDSEIHQRVVDDLEVNAYVEVALGSIADQLELIMERQPDATVVMASHGRGRSAALVGSITEELLQRQFGPILVVGPHVDPSREMLSGPLVVSIDGSALSEEALPLASAWAVELGLTPWVVEVNEPTTASTTHLVESSYPARMARHMTQLSGHQTEFEVLHDHHPHDGIVEFADRVGAGMIVATTHGRTGLSRLRLGSTAASVVRHATCPVLLLRPPHLAADGEGAAASRDRGEVAPT